MPTFTAIEDITTVSFTINRAPLMMLFAYCVLRSMYPSFGAASHLSIASATAATAAIQKAKSIGLKSSKDSSSIPKGLRSIKSLGSIEVGVIRRGDVEEGYWGLDIDAMERRAGITSEGDKPELKASDASWIHPAQVRDYLFRAFGEKNLKAAHGAIDLVIASWSEQSEFDLSSRAWEWYVRVRPTVAQGQEGWGQKSLVKCSDILTCCRKSD